MSNRSSTLSALVAVVAAGGLLTVLAFWPGRRTTPAPAA